MLETLSLHVACLAGGNEGVSTGTTRHQQAKLVTTGPLGDDIGTFEGFLYLAAPLDLFNVW